MDNKFCFIDRNSYIRYTTGKCKKEDYNLNLKIIPTKKESEENYLDSRFRGNDICNSMNKAELAQTLADKVGITRKEAEDVVGAFVQVVTQTLQAGGEVNIAGFGAFSAKMRKGRTGVNPQNPSQKIQIPPVTVPKFKAGKGLKDALKNRM